VTRVAVIGVGAMGRHHARVYSEMPDAELVGVADIDAALAEATGKHLGVPAYTDFQQLLIAQKPEAVSIAVPTIDHQAVALAAIDRGMHVLIEKPIALNVDQGRSIIEAADRSGVRLMIGHIERFNPAIVALKDRLAHHELGRLFQIEARRQGPSLSRASDAGVAIDLAVHDLDVMCYLSGSQVVRVFAETERRIHGAREDLLTGVLRFADGMIGTLTINWLTPTKIRELYVTGERGMFRVDYLTQDLSLFENATMHGGDWNALQLLRGVSEGRMVRYALAKTEPLRAELEAWLAAVRGEAPVRVTGEAGLRALELAQAIVTSGTEHRVIRFNVSSPTSPQN
jgi:UDP-N-acetylglucosamine 3-dehydrogenase